MTWRVNDGVSGQPYAGAEQDTLVVLPRHPGMVRPATDTPPHYPLSQRGPFRLAGYAATLTLLATAASQDPVALAGLTAVPAALGWAAGRLTQMRRALPDALPLDLVAHAICDAYLDLGELSAEAAASLAIEPRASGYMRCFLRTATTAESERFVRALDDTITPAGFPRYLISRLVPDPRGGVIRLARVLARRPPFGRRWVAVPEDLGRTKRRAEAFAKGWRRWLGPGELQFTQRSPAGRDAVATASAQGTDYEMSSRRIWV